MTDTHPFGTKLVSRVTDELNVGKAADKAG